ncbi:DUF3854 domain-containing protein [Promicromonospora sp. NPDC057138]|uniref:DUF3854 domain-containing protein n=1 Tax=Promicromonospora sp. NPDC057138 TaxID=3346031 RepID=UPI00364202F8
MTSTSRTLTPNHVEKLEESAIDEATARAWGIYSAVVPADLPADLAEYGSASGIVFPLRRANGTVVHQLRLDEPKPDGPKYLQPKATGAIVNVPDMMAHRIQTATKKLIVEGTKQTITASTTVADDWAVIGIQGCANFSRDGVPLQEWSSLVRPGDEVVICFDADWSTNHNVWDAARRLKGHLETNCLAVSVRMITISGGGKLGLDDALRSQADPALRPAVLAEMIARATDKLGREPRRRPDKVVKLASTIEVDMAAGRIVRRAVLPDGAPPGAHAPPEEVLLNAAARIVEIESLVAEDDRTTSDAQLTLEVAVPVMGRPAPAVHRVKVASSALATTGTWLDRLPNGIGVSIPRDTRPNDEVANAIRAADAERTFISVVPRMGWYLDVDCDEPVWRWMDGGGAIGPEGKIRTLRGKPGARDFQAIDLPDPAELDDDVVRERVRDFVFARDLFLPEQRFKWDAAVAGWALAFLGVTPNAALAYFGPKSSGKSTVAQAIAATLNPAWAPESGVAMATFNARPAGMDLLANGMQHIFLHVDDLKPDADAQSMKNALKAFDALLRRAHGSGGAVRGGVDKTHDALIVRGVDAAAPFVLVTGEEIPTGGDFAESGLDRALIIPVAPNTLFGEDRTNLDILTRRAKSGRFLPVTSAFLRWVAEAIDEMDVDDPAGRFDAWKDQVEQDRGTANRTVMTGGHLDLEDNVSDRAKQLAASLTVGLNYLMFFAKDVGAVSADEASGILAEFGVALMAAIRTHTTEIMGGNATPYQRAMAMLRAAVASREVSLDPDETPNRPLIGQLDKELSDGTSVIAINHAAAANALRYPGGARALSQALSAKAIRHRGLPTRTLRLHGTPVQVVCLPADEWDDHESDEGPLTPR